MHHGGHAGLFVARASGAEVVPRRVSAGTATAAIIVDRVGEQLRFDLTFHGLERGAPSRIALFNFGRGGNGELVAVLCGAGAQPCPDRPSARLSGVKAMRFSPHLMSEFASVRIYLQIEGHDGIPEIRGQLDMNGAMVPVRNYVARLAPQSAQGRGEGTATLSETYLPRGRVAVSYNVTIAGASGSPEAVSLLGAPSLSGVGAARFRRSGQLPGALRPPGSAARGGGGGSLSGSYVARRDDRSTALAVNLVAANNVPVIVVRTSRFPQGELAGVFMPVE